MKTFNLKYKIAFPDGRNIIGEKEVKGLLFMTAAWKLQQTLKKEHGSDSGVNVLVDLRKEKT